MWAVIADLVLSVIKWIAGRSGKSDVDFSNERTEESLDVAQKNVTKTESELLENEKNAKQTQTILESIDPDDNDGFGRVLKSNEIARKSAIEANRGLPKD